MEERDDTDVRSSATKSLSSHHNSDGGCERAREGSNVSSHPRMSFSPVSDWMPERQRKESAGTTGAVQEVSKAKLIGRLSQIARWNLH